MPSRAIRRLLAVALLLLLGGLSFLIVKYHNRSSLPPGIASGNGRLEATEVDVASKIPGRLASVAAREGDDVTAGEVLAQLDADDLKAQLRAAEAQIRQARAAAAESRSALAGAESQQRMARLTLRRTSRLVAKGFVSAEKLDRDRSGLQVAEASASAARSRVKAADEAIAAAEARVDALRVSIDDTALKAPLAGRVLYRLAQPGEVLAAGGKVLTLLDTTDVYLSIYLPAFESGKVVLGSPARIVLDALPGDPIPARVTYVAPRSQFTPKEVETRNEREKLMFRIKVQADSVWLKTHAGLAKPGMPGMAYVLTEHNAAWPADLSPR